MNWTILLQVVTILVAVIAPSVTAVINNHYAIKIEREKFMRDKKRQAIHDYLNAAGHSILAKYRTGNEEYSQSKYVIFLYASKSTWKDIQMFDELLSNGCFEEAQQQLQHLSKLLSASI